MALFRGVDSCRPHGAPVRAHKPPWRGVEDSPLRTFAAVTTTMRSQPSSSKSPPPQRAPGAGSSGSSRNLAASEEELAMIELKVLPPSYKDLASASVHLTPQSFMKGCYDAPEGNF